MALQLSIASGYGVNFTYWIPGSITEDRYNSTAHVTMYGFVDEAAREARAECISKNLFFDAGVWVRDASIAQTYALVKATAEFADAVDV